MDQLNLSSEDRLLLYCARINMSEDITCEIKEILNDCLNWDYIVESSMKHGISPLLFWNLSKIDNDKDVPAEVMAKLRKLYYGNIARNRLLYDELRKVLKAFLDAGIDVIVLKGAFLAEAVYKNIGLRPMSDIDLLIKKDDLQKVKKELIQLRYQLDEKWNEQWQNEQLEEITYTNGDENIWIDVHWNIQPLSRPFQVDINKFWEKAQPVKIAGVETLMLAPEDLLQHLCLHLDKHLISGLIPFIWYCDIAEVIRHYNGKINWKYLVQSSKSYGIEKPLYQSLYLVTKYIGVFVPIILLTAFENFKFDVRIRY